MYDLHRVNYKRVFDMLIEYKTLLGVIINNMCGYVTNIYVTTYRTLNNIIFNRFYYKFIFYSTKD